VDDVKAYKSVLNGSISPTASSGEKRMAGIISDKLGNLEDSSIIRFAKSDAVPPELKPRINQLLDQRKAADAIYKPFRENLNTLAEQLGKGKTYGAQDAINFIQNKLTPEEVVQKLFSKKDSEFLKFFQKNFPDQMELMRQYQKGLIRDAASASKEGFNPTSVFKQVNKLEPEIQKSLFSSADLQKLRAAQTVSESIPKSFNPSHTNDTSAFRSFFESPTGALIGNARDLALHAYIKSAGGGIQGATTDALQGHVGKMSSGIEKGVKGMFTGAAAQPKKGK